MKTRQPFRRCKSCPAPPVARRQVDHCLAVPLPALAGRSYSGHSPSLRHLKHLDDFFHAPATTPAATVIPVLSLTFTQPFTSLVVLPTGLMLYVRASRHGIVSIGNCAEARSR